MTFSTLGTMASYVPKQGVTGTVDLSTATVVKGAGMDLITPTSVAGSGVTLSGGQVTFTAATAITVNGVFTATYDNYMIVSRLKSASNDQLQGRFVLSGTAAATNYQSQYVESYSTTTVSTAYGVSTYMSIGQVGASFNNLLTATVSGPALASDTALISQCAYMQSAGALRGYQGWGVHTTATAYDGFFMKTNADQALTGTLRIYGLRNS